MYVKTKYIKKKGHIGSQGHDFVGFFVSCSQIYVTRIIQHTLSASTTQG